MTILNEIYKCEVCGNTVEVVHQSGGTLVCCGKPMTKLAENSVEAAKEKHIPVTEKVQDGICVKVGEVEHPMLDNHYIEWIEVHTKNKIYRKYLKPGEKPQALFKVDEEIIAVKEYCSVHGVWKG